MEYAREGQANMACDQAKRPEGAGAALGYGAAAAMQQTTDPWKHRSEGMRCKTCMWFNPKAPQSGLIGNPANPRIYDVGRCRRHAPTMGGYPVVFVNDWCGDHRLNENAI